MAAQSVRVEGLKEFMRAVNKADKETKKLVRSRFKQVGEIVRSESASRFSRIDAGSASGFKVKVRTRGVSVEQTRKKVTGKRGDYAHLQQKGTLEPVLRDKQDEVVREVEKAVDDVADIVRRA